MEAIDFDPALPLLLALCTSSERCSVALGQPGRAAAVVHGTDQPGNSGQILALADRLLARSNLTLAGVDAIAFDQGPGAFTGLRVGCAVAQGLGWALGRPVVPVGTLAATAWQAATAIAAARFGVVLVANDARMGDVYLGLVEVNAQGGARAVWAPQVLSPEAAIARLSARQAMPLALAAGDGLERYPELPVWATANGVPHVVTGRADATAVLALALHDYGCGVRIDPAQAAPLYVRDKVALDVTEQRLARAG